MLESKTLRRIKQSELLVEAEAGLGLSSEESLPMRRLSEKAHP